MTHNSIDMTPEYDEVGLVCLVLFVLTNDQQLSDSDIQVHREVHPGEDFLFCLLLIVYSLIRDHRQHLRPSCLTSSLYIVIKYKSSSDNSLWVQRLLLANVFCLFGFPACSDLVNTTRTLNGLQMETRTFLIPKYFPSPTDSASMRRYLST